MKDRAAKDIFTQIVTVIPSENGYLNGKYIQQEIPLVSVIRDMQNLPNVRERLVDTLSAPYHSQEQHDLKSSLPRYYIAGTFPQKMIRDKELVNPTNLMTVDIDKKDNPDIDFLELKKKIFSLPYVAGVYTSASGQGCYAIIPIEDYTKTKQYHAYLLQMWAHTLNIYIDKNCSNIARARILSFNDDWSDWTKTDNVKVFDLYTQEVHIEKPSQELTLPFKEIENDKDLVHKAIWQVLNSGYTVSNYNAWYHVGCEFANFSDGDLMFKRLSDNYGKQTASVDEKYKQCLKNPAPIEQVKVKWLGMAKNMFGPKWWKK